MSAPAILELRDLLAAKYPAPPPQAAASFPTGFACFDQHEGGLRCGAITELAGSIGAGGLFLTAMLSVLPREKCFAALVDGGRSFNPESCATASLRRLLIVACRDEKQAVQATDLLLRDGNLPLVLLDLQTLPARALRRIPASTWHRFQRLVEPTGTALVVLSRQPMVEAAQWRIAVRNGWSLDAMRERRRGLVEQIDAQIFARRDFAGLHVLPRESA